MFSKRNLNYIYIYIELFVNVFILILIIVFMGVGIYSVQVDYNQQKVTIRGICNKYNLLTTIRSKRKEARFWNPDDNIALEESSPQSPSPSDHPRDSKPSLALTRVRSLTMKAWKKVFTRSFSF
jgi:hypothetical protein